MKILSSEPRHVRNLTAFIRKTAFKNASRAICVAFVMLLLVSGGYRTYAFDWGDEEKAKDESVFTIKNAAEFGIYSMEFSSDYKSIYVCDWREVRKWDTKTGEKLAESDYEEYVMEGFDVSPNGKYVATGGGEIELRSATDLKTIRSSDFYSGEKGIDSQVVAFTRDSKYIITTDYEAIRLFSVPDLKLVRKVGDLENKRFQDICLNSDGSMVALCNDHGEIYLIDGNNWIPLKIISDLQEMVMSIQFSPDDKLLAAGLYSGEIIIFQLDPLVIKHSFFGHQDNTSSIAFSPDGKMLASGGSQFTDIMLKMDPTINIWSVETGKLIKILEGHHVSVEAVAFNPEQKQLASCGGSQEPFSWQCIKFWNLGELLKN